MIVREKKHPLPKPNYAILISSKEDKHADQIENIIKDRIKVAKLGIGITGLKKTMQNKIILTCEKHNDAETILHEINKQSNHGIYANEIKKNKPCIIIKGVESTYKEEELISDIIDQNEDIKSAMESEKDAQPICVKKN